VDPPRSTEKIVFLSWAVIEDGEGQRRAVRIVGQDETDAKAGHISWRSPVGRALLNKRADDTVVVDTPGGRVEYTIVGIHLSAPASLD
jgi:transcription elongation GreA/GreB family factor